MKAIPWFHPALTVALCLLSALVSAQHPEPTLKAGDPAPALRIRQWMQGTPIEKLDKGQVYVFEFWATWCGPCIAAMPHLSELAKKYEGKATFTGVDVWEHQYYPGTDPVKLVEKFMQDNPGRMTYNVAVDDSNHMGDNWLHAAGQRGIPSSFIIDGEGRIAWIGHPHYMEPVLEKVVAGTFDLAAYTAEEKAKRDARAAADAPDRAITQPVNDAFQAKDYAKAVALAEAIDKDHPRLAMRVATTKFRAMVDGKFDSAIQASFQKEQPLRDVLALYVTEADGLQPDSYRAAAKFMDEFPRKPGTKVINLLHFSARASFKAGDYDKAIATAQQAADLAVKDGLLDTQIKVYTDLVDEAKAARGAASVQERVKPLKPGDSAPKLQVVEWLKGKPITRFQKGKVYLVEYWATWCGPCISNIPHLTELQKKYGKDGLVIIGMTNPDVDAGSTGPRKENNTLQQVRDFMAKRGDDMAYHVAYDTPMRDTFKSMMGQSGGIPHAFLFGRDGKLLIDGHPFFLDTAIEKAINNTWDDIAGPADVKRNRTVYWAAQGAKNYPEFSANFSILERDYPAMAQRLQDLKFNQSLKGGQIDPAITAGRQLIAYSRETGNADALARATLPVARDLAALKRGAFGGVLPDDQSKQLTDVLGQMADAAEQINDDDYQSFAAQAELASLAGNARRAVELQKQAMARVPERSKETEQKRADEYASAVSAQERREEMMRRQQERQGEGQ